MNNTPWKSLKRRAKFLNCYGITLLLVLLGLAAVVIHELTSRRARQLLIRDTKTETTHGWINKLKSGQMDQILHDSQPDSRRERRPVTYTDIAKRYFGFHKQLSYTKTHNVQNESTFQKPLTTMPSIKKVVTLTEDIKMLLSKPVINHHDYKYLHNPKSTCAEKQVDILFVVPSAPGNEFKRRKVRTSSLYSYTRNLEHKAALVFFTGLPSSTSKTRKDSQSDIDTESSKFNDIVQQNFTDIYRNIRLKAVSMLQWASLHCYTAKYVIRTDDDVEVKVRDLVNVIKRVGKENDNFVIGKVVKNRLVSRYNISKYFTSRDEYPKDLWPPFALGGLLGYPLATVRLLYEAALRTRPVWLDDVFITAFCRRQVNASLLSDPIFTFTELDIFQFEPYLRGKGL